MTDERPLYAEVLDFIAQLPLGVARRVAKEFPDLLKESRSRLEGPAQMAENLGRAAVGVAQSTIESLVRSIGSRNPDGQHDFAGEPVAERPVGAAQSPGSADIDPSVLAIADYDSLRASEVIHLLAGLSTEELEAVRRYEEATRYRRTVLGRISQLESGERYST